MNLVFKILILGGLYGIYKLIKEILGQHHCPSDSELREVALGIVKKNSATADKVIMHLGVCDECRKKVSDIGSE